MTPSPYAPPRAPIAPYGTVDTKLGDALPLVCLKCGTTHEVATRVQSLMVLRRARLSTLAVALFGGVVVAVVRSPEIRAVVFIALAIVAFFLRRFVNPRIDFPVPLCAFCTSRWASGLLWSKIFRIAMLGCSVAATALAFAGVSPFLLLVFALGIVSAMIALLLLRMRSRIVVARDVKGDVVTLALVHQDAVAAIRTTTPQ